MEKLMFLKSEETGVE